MSVYIYRHYDFPLFLIQYIKIALLKKMLLQIFSLLYGMALRGWIITIWKSLTRDYHIFIP